MIRNNIKTQVIPIVPSPNHAVGTSQQQFIKITNALSRFLGRDILLHSPSTSDVIGQTVHYALELDRQRMYRERDNVKNRLGMLARHLDNISRYDKKLLKYFRKKLNGSNNHETYYGFRFEINTASILITNGIKFTCQMKQSKPDFKVHYNGEEINIECAVTQLRKSKSGDLQYKINSTINKKSKKPYCKDSTALFIDFTNIGYNSIIGGEHFIGHRDIKTDSFEALKETNFGSLVLFAYFSNNNHKYFDHDYFRVDNTKTSDGLKCFLNDMYSFGKGDMKRIDWIPEGG